MSATITVQSGVSAGTTYWIERPVLRVGSDPDSDLCLLSTDVNAHALTIEYRNGRYQVHNRSSASIQIGRQAVAVGKSAHWLPEHALGLSGGTELVLDVDGDGAPCPKPTDNFDADGENDEVIRTTDKDGGSPEAKAKRSKNGTQLAVIAVCVLGMGFMMIPRDSTGTKQPTAPIFSQVVRDAVKSDTTSPLLVQRLQYAQAALVRGNTSTARKRFQKLKDDLVKQREEFIGYERENELAVLNYVEYQLLQLK